MEENKMSRLPSLSQVSKVFDLPFSLREKYQSNKSFH